MYSVYIEFHVMGVRGWFCAIRRKEKYEEQTKLF